MLPWILGATIPSLLVSLLDLPRDVGGLIIFTITCVAAAGGLYAGWRVSMYGWQFDRTPANATWAEVQAGQALIAALRRVTLNSLSKLTLTTRLRADLKLTSADMSELLTILKAERWLDAGRIENVGRDDFTVETLLTLMSRSQDLVSVG